MVMSTLFVSQIAPAFAASKSLSVPFFSQQPHQNICWAASASMTTAYFNKNTTDLKVAIATAVNGSDFNKGLPVATALNTERDQIYSRTSAYMYGSVYQTNLSWTAVKYQIDSGGPINTQILWTSGGGHAENIIGYDETVSYKNIYYLDPWDSSKQTRIMAYNNYVSNSLFYWDKSLFFK